MNAVTLSHAIIKSQVKAGGFCIDATAGRGNDTAYLCSIVGKGGRVLAFDIQQEAIDSTKLRLEKEGYSAQLVLDSHANMAKYAEENTVDCIVFNLGYLPSGNHNIFTSFSSSVNAITAGLQLLKHGGLMSVLIYYGGDSGYEERDALLPWLKTLDSAKYQVLKTDFFNWTNDPPISIIITKN
ncbi:MAG: class I SAM-dependent methyltransferase [Clostridia bacterium]